QGDWESYFLGRDSLNWSKVGLNSAGAVDSANTPTFTLRGSSGVAAPPTVDHSSPSLLNPPHTRTPRLSTRRYAGALRAGPCLPPRNQPRWPRRSLPKAMVFQSSGLAELSATRSTRTNT